MAEMVLSPLVDMVIKALVSPLVDKGRMIWQVSDDIEDLHKTLLGIQGLLADAQAKQITDSMVKNWLRDLKDVAYDADDVLDEIVYEALRQEAQGEANKLGKTKQVCSFFPSRFCSCFGLNIKQVPFKRDIANRIKDINVRLAKIHVNRLNLGLTVADGRRASEPLRRRLLTTSLLPESEIIGRDKGREYIIKLLLSDGKQVSVISIVGMGGLGKTTLAQLVYNDQNVENYFETRAWVCVSEYFDVPRLTEEIIEAASTETIDSSLPLDHKQRKLQEILGGKRFLIVLDDVWNEDQGAWERLAAPFRVGARGSKIIVTTRAGSVSKAMNSDYLYPLEFLGYEDCLSLFLRHAFPSENLDAINQELKKIGMELVQRRCHGLPLAAKTLGGLLSYNRDLNFWQSIIDNQLWSSMGYESGLMQALRVSYHHLPPHFKQCFAFCSIFPKYHEFEKDNLVQLWMAQGFIQPIPGITLGTLEEEIGSEYFDFLLSMSFFQVEPERGYKNEILYKMHDCIHDLAMLVSSDECFRFEHGMPSSSPLKGHRHSSFILDKDTKAEDFGHLYKCKGLRTFILNCHWGIGLDILNQVIRDLIMNLRCLRALVLKRSALIELPDSISNLKQLRYLNLSNTKITQLPESVSSLYNLQTLNLSHCCELYQLPKETRKLVNLRHLNLYGCVSLESMPPEMGRLTCLQTLTTFIVGREKGCGIGELKGLTALKGTIWIKKLNNVSNAKEAEEANLKGKPNIEQLELEWDNEFDEEDAANMNMKQDQASLEELGNILEALQPHINIKSLSLDGYGGKNFPSWLQDAILPNLERLYILKCTNCNSIPPLGQCRRLKNLIIVDIPGVKCIGHEFYGDGEIMAFPSLEVLEIMEMPNLVEWCQVEGSEFPCLLRVFIFNCPKLIKMPKFFSTVKHLSLFHCHKLACLPRLPSLNELWLADCNEILLRWVPNLTSLSNLTIEYFKELKSLPEEMLQPLGNLKKLQISMCEKLVCLLEEDKSLPSTLTSLHISCCDNLKSLPKGLQSLTTFKNLVIWYCPQLLSLPEEGLPATLQYLEISKCEKLSEQCQKGDGDDWAKISHIPCVQIDGEIGKEGLLAILQYLEISKCAKLREQCRKKDGDNWGKISHIPRS